MLLLGLMKSNIDLNTHERAYRSVLNYTGVCLLFFLFFINVRTFVADIINLLAYLMPYDTYYTLSQITAIITYLVSFIVPALILRRFLRGKELLEPMRLGFRSSGAAWLLIPATVGVNLCASYLNSLFMSASGLTETYSELLSSAEQPYRPYQILLLFVLTALVPAICEEFFFRGTILSNLLPFGQGTAIIVSAVLFGLMHQNPYQLLYTTVAGLMMGYAYVKTGSIWYPTVIHFVNNSFAVLQDVLYANCGEAVAGTVAIIMNIVVIIVGFICFAVYLIIDADKERTKYIRGSFGRTIVPCEGYAERKIRPEKKIKLFFSPGIMAFLILAVLGMVLLMLSLVSLAGGTVQI